MVRDEASACYPLFGVVPIINTPFTADDTIDIRALERLVDQSIADGISGCIVPAVASEEGKLSGTERRYLVESVIDLAAGRIPVVVGVSSENADTSRALAQHAVERGCAGVLSRCPPSLLGDPGATKAYFASLDVPMLMIQDLDWSGPGMELKLIMDMFESIPAFRCLKVETVPAGVKYSAVLKATGGALNVSGGWAIPQMIEALDRGVHAFNTTAVNRPFVAVYEAYMRGDREMAVHLFEEILPYLAWSHQHIDISIQFLKEYCMRKGLFTTAQVRPPIMPLDGYHQRRAGELIEKILRIERRLEVEDSSGGRLEQG